MDGLILDEAFEQPTKLAVKINFLQHEKDNLEETVREMSDNIKVYKRIIEQLTEAAQTKVENADGVVSEIVVKLTRLNDGLQQRIEHLMEQVASLKCTILLRDQIMEEQEQQSLSVLRNYEDKILELRRAIQDKEYAIQEKENPRQRCDVPGKKDYIMDPKQEAMRMNGELQDLKELIRKLTLDNNELRKKNTELADELAKKVLKTDKLETLLESAVSYQTAKMLYDRNNQKLRPSSEEKVSLGKKRSNVEKQDLSKEETQFSKKRGTSKAYTGTSNYNDSYFIRNETMTYLRQLLFREKKTSELLGRALAQLNNSYNNLVNSNKLLAESNINYQVRRSKQQQELNFYKRKNQELLAIVMRRRVRAQRSLDRTREEQVIRNIPQQQQVQHNYQELHSCLKGMQSEIEQSTSTLARITTRSFFQRIRERRSRHISYSCPTDYLPKQEMDSVEQFIKRQQQKLKKEQPREDGPFLADFSMIAAKQDKPISFAEFSSSHGFKKRKLISDSFIQITEEILKH